MGIQEKRTSDGGIERYEARLVACGNEQVLGMNFLLKFAAVLDMTSAKAILAIAWIWRTPARHSTCQVLTCELLKKMKFIVIFIFLKEWFLR